MTSVTIYHNPACSKSRRTLALLRDTGHQPNIVLYLEQTPTKAILQDIINKLGIAPRDLIRTGEAAYQTLNLARDELTDSELLDAMLTAPILMQRPVVVCGDRARIGRPPEAVLDIL